MEHLGESIHRKLENRVAHKIMSAEQIRSVENRIATLGLAPENFNENNGFSFDPEKEGRGIEQRLSKLDDITLLALVRELDKYHMYMVSSKGFRDAISGHRPTIDERGSGYFGDLDRIKYMREAIRQERKKRNLGIWSALLKYDSTLDREEEIWKDIEETRSVKRQADLLGDDIDPAMFR